MRQVFRKRVSGEIVDRAGRRPTPSLVVPKTKRRRQHRARPNQRPETKPDTSRSDIHPFNRGPGELLHTLKLPVILPANALQQQIVGCRGVR